MIRIAYLRSLAVKKCMTIIELSNMRRYSGKANELRYTNTIRGGGGGGGGHRGTSPSRIGKINNIKIIPLLINKIKSKNAVSVSEAFALFGIYSANHLFNTNIIDSGEHKSKLPA